MKLNQNHVDQILQNIKSGQIEKGLLLTNSLLKTNKNSLHLNKLAAYIYGLKDKHRLSIQILNDIKNNFPEDFDISNNLGHAYLHEEKIDLAIENINKAIKINPESPAPYKNLAEVYLILRDFDKAGTAINSCIEKTEKVSHDFQEFINVILIKIQILLAQKQKTLAINLITKYLEKKFEPELCYELVNIDKNEVTNNLLKISLAQIEKNIYKSHLDKFNKLSPLLFFLANYYESSDNALSEKYYVQANKEVINIQRLKVIVFQQKFGKIIDNYELIKNLEISDQNRGSENIFIVGMPRSGTSLLESVITANNQVFPGGELRSMNSLYNNFEDSKKIDLTKEIDFIGQEYSNITDLIKGNRQKIVDKMPLNFSLIGYILKSLPRSKIILLLRDPWDIAISLYKQRYVKNITYAASFFNIGVYMANFEAIVNFWINFDNIDNKIYKLKYEQLVKNFHEKQKDLYEFCHIQDAFNEEFRKNHFVRTASINQVNSNVHSKSVQKKSFDAYKPEFFDTYNMQKQFWIKRGISFKKNFFGYLDK